jgi:DNA-binding MarR family transcriptional regulator
MANTGLARDLAQALGQLLLRRNRSALYDAVLDSAPPGVDRQTYPVLSGLDRLGPQSAARLAEEVGIDRSGASRYADRLETAGLVERSPDPCDGRATLLSLTPEGRAAVTVLRDALTRHLAGLIADWPDGQAQALIDGMRLLIDPTCTPAAKAPAPASGPRSLET